MPMIHARQSTRWLAPRVAGLILLGIVFGVFLLLPSQAAWAQEAIPENSGTIPFKPEVPLPNFAGGPISATSFASYIRAVFVYFIWTVGLLAGIMIIWGGIKWVSAAGNPTKINDARDVINNAIIGLVLALVSVVMLNIINPRLTSFQGLTINPAPRIPFESDTAAGEFNEGLDCRSDDGARMIRESQCFITSIRLPWPVLDVDHRIPGAGHFGPRDPGGVGSKCHGGTDITTNRVTGKQVIAMHVGEVIEVKTICGEPSIKIKAPHSFYTRYLHLKSVNVAVGDPVQQGQVIGLSGGDPNNGATCSQAPHVHVEIYALPKTIRDIEPCLIQE